jgi:hypothetical protein
MTRESLDEKFNRLESRFKLESQVGFFYIIIIQK